MGAIPLYYIWRNLWTRRLTTVLTLAGIALVTFVFAAVLMLANGLESALVESGSDDNAIVIRKSSNSEIVSQIDRDAANIIKTEPEIARLPDGKPIASGEVYVIINLNKRSTHDMSNLVVRGVSPQGFMLRPQVKMAAGKMFGFGTNEIIVGSDVARQFEGCNIGDKLRFGDDTWTIVGVFDGSGSAFDSEIWGDADRIMPAFGRPVFSSLTLRLTSPNAFDALKASIEKDPRTDYADVKREREYYREQSKLMADLIEILGLIVTMIFSIGAIIGAMITMYAAVANRTTEIGTLRALGFRRRSILLAFLVESALLASIGGGAGLALASLTTFIRISTVNFGSFSELAFGFSLSAGIIGGTMIFAFIMGIVGGVLPAGRAARMSIIAALRPS